MPYPAKNVPRPGEIRNPGAGSETADRGRDCWRSISRFGPAITPVDDAEYLSFVFTVPEYWICGILVASKLIRHVSPV